MTNELMDSETVFKEPSSCNLRALKQVQPLYLLPQDNLAEEVLIPCFQAACQVDCMVGFFSSEVLGSLAPGLAAYISSSQNSFRLIISPLVRSDDLAAIEDGVKTAENVVYSILEELIITEDLLQQHTLKCLTYLLHTKRLEIQVALMKGALFHPKVWLFLSENDVIAAHGSSNVTYAGIKRNIEQIAISKSWEDPNQLYITKKLRLQFIRLWENKEESCIIIPLPQAVKDKLLRTYDTDKSPTEDDLRALREYSTGYLDKSENDKVHHLPKTTFTIPSELRFNDGPFAHQGKAVAAWCNAGYRGVLEMATGSGKTITAMISAYRLFQRYKPLLIVIGAPYVPLVEQWCEEIAPFGMKPTNLTTVGGEQQRSRELQGIKRRLRTGISETEAIVVSHDTLCTNAFHEAISSFDCAKLLIADEAHNLGSPSFINNTPEFFEYRLALSATPIRQYDQEGTDALFDFFGPVVFQFTLEEAIGKCLVEYDYFIHPAYLSTLEMDRWYELTEKIKQNTWRDKDGKPDEFLAKLMRDRRALLETAENKLTVLSRLIDDENLNDLQHTLIYATDKAPVQLDSINFLLNKKGVLFHQLTAEETSSREQTKRIIKSFQDGEIQVLTAKRVLDEGVNIPQICKAYILASTTVERQWIQRRGRLLRTCNSIGKTFSIIHDFVALPSELDEKLDADARRLVRSELNRVQEFARLARNAGRQDGPLAVIDKLVNAAYL